MTSITKAGPKAEGQKMLQLSIVLQSAVSPDQPPRWSCDLSENYGSLGPNLSGPLEKQYLQDQRSIANDELAAAKTELQDATKALDDLMKSATATPQQKASAQLDNTIAWDHVHIARDKIHVLDQLIAYLDKYIQELKDHDNLPAAKSTGTDKPPMYGNEAYANPPIQIDPVKKDPNTTLAGVGIPTPDPNSAPYSTSTKPLTETTTFAQTTPPVTDTQTTNSVADLLNSGSSNLLQTAFNSINNLTGGLLSDLTSIIPGSNEIINVGLGASNDPMNIALLAQTDTPMSDTAMTDLLARVDTGGVQLNSAIDQPNINTTNQILNTDTHAYPVQAPETITNPLDPTQKSDSVVDNVHHVPIANEPQDDYAGQYPYNKSMQTEGGHIIEIDDTPGAKRLLNKHVSGTYNEVNNEGRLVTKVVSDNYTIVAEDNYVTIQGSCMVRILGDATVRIGGHLNFQADAGVAITTKGDLRVNARSINMEAYGGDVNIKAAGSTNISSAQDFNVVSQENHMDSGSKTSISSGGNIALSGVDIGATASGKASVIGGAGAYLEGSEVNVGASGDVNIDGAMTYIQSGKTQNASPPVAVPAAQAKGSGILYSTSPDRLIEDNDDDPVGAAAAIKHGVDNNMISQDELNTPIGQPSSSDSNPPANTNKPVSTSPTVGNLGSGPPPENLKLSPSFTLAMLSSAAAAVQHVVQAQHGLTTTQIVGNLQLLATNCLEIIKKQYPDMKVTCGFRHTGYKATYGAKGTSQHELGMACDLQFASANRNPGMYYDIAKWIKENVPFDQLILEYKSTGSKLPWIHVSFSGKGNRDWGAANKCITMNNGSTVCRGLAQYR